MMKHVIKSMAIILSLSFANASYGQAPAKEATCRACHGVGGGAPIAPSYPKINGQNRAYLVSALKAYRDGGRKGGVAAVMAAQAAQLSDSDIDALAEYYSTQK